MSSIVNPSLRDSIVITTTTVPSGIFTINEMKPFIMNIYIGSCLALNLNYSGCCEKSLSPPCSINGCFCDKDCHNEGDCCSDVADIECYPVNLTSPMPITTKTLGKKK